MVWMVRAIVQLVVWITDNIIQLKKIKRKRLKDVDKKISATCDIVTKVDHDAKTTEIESKAPDIMGLLTKTNFNLEVTEIENKVPDITVLVTKTEFSTKTSEFKNKISDVTELTKDPILIQN